MNRKQSGFAHLQVVLIAVFVLSVVGYSAYRVGENRSSSNRQTESQDVNLVDGIKVNEAEDQTKEVTIPKEEKKVEETEAAKKVTATTEKKTETVEKKKDKVWVEMQKVSVVQDGAVLKIASRLPSAYSGTCNFKLWQDGYEKVYASKSINNSKDCVGQLSVADLETYSGWELHVWFDSSDGKTSASQKTAPVSLTNPS